MRELIIKELNKLQRTRYWLANESGVARSNLYSWLEGKNTLGEDAINRLASTINKNGGKCGRWYANIRGGWHEQYKPYYFNTYDEIIERVRGMVINPDDQDNYYESFSIINGSHDVGGTEIAKGIIEAFDSRITFSLTFTIQEYF